jgi:hypothetical protein
MLSPRFVGCLAAHDAKLQQSSGGPLHRTAGTHACLFTTWRDTFHGSAAMTSTELQNNSFNANCTMRG